MQAPGCSIQLIILAEGVVHRPDRPGRLYGERLLCSVESSDTGTPKPWGVIGYYIYRGGVYNKHP